MTDSLANATDNYVEDSAYSLTLDTTKTLTNSPSFSPASKFEHNRQAAKWVMTKIDVNPQYTSYSNNYLLVETIPPEWFLLSVTSKYRLSGWKDGSLIYKIKNALI